MKIQATVDQILHQKSPQIWSVPPTATVYEAIELLAARNIGAVLVMEGERLVGIFTERDYTRKIILQGRSSKETPINDVISSPVKTVSPEDSLESCMKLMTDRRIRHLPVVKDGKVVGVLSIGDLVNWIIHTQQAALEQLQSYLSGGVPA